MSLTKTVREVSVLPASARLIRIFLASVIAITALVFLTPDVGAESIAPQTPESAPRATDIREYAVNVAKEHGLNVGHFLAVIQCESQWQSDVKSKFPGEDSWGLVQINLPSNPGITKEQATDPYFSVDFMAREWERGNAHHWTCWRELSTQ